MFKLVIVGTVAALATAEMSHPINKEIVEDIKSKTSLWQPAEPEENPLSTYSVEKIMGLMGTTITAPGNFPGPIMVDAPTSFDSRTEWPDCIHAIRDQAQCGSCWAFAGSETLSDRFCIASKGSVNVVLSPQDMVSCDSWNMGCSGGILPWAWSYLTTDGIVSDSCIPYTSQTGTAPKCPAKCDDGSDLKKYKCKKGSVVSASGQKQIQSEISQNGPLETGFTVYKDFMSYKSGIYEYVSGEQLGGHAVKIVGYGEENGVQYYICANSWGPKWGEEGFFRIKVGQCGIDNAAYGCTPDV